MSQQDAENARSSLENSQAAPSRTRKHPHELIPGLAEFGFAVVNIPGERANEGQWRESQLTLEMRGYLLRPRYSAYWMPSWSQRGTGILPTDEDAVALRASSVSNLSSFRNLTRPASF